MSKTSDAKKREYIKGYLQSNGIKATSKGYKALYYAIFEAASHPEYSCSELFDVSAKKLSEDSVSEIDGKTAYRNAHYAIKNSRNGAFGGGPFDFIKSCSIELESM